jgi:hypothetical protein
MTARWSDRQVAMLREMGVQHFWPLQPEAEAPASAAPPAAEPMHPPWHRRCLNGRPRRLPRVRPWPLRDPVA